MMRRLLYLLLGFVIGVCLGQSYAVAAESSSAPAAPQSKWRQLIQEAKALNLPAEFLEAIPEDFVVIEFEDLHTYAAEYHPEDHRMVLNRTLSFNAAGSILRPLRTLPHRDIGTLFHELFHAYMDYLVAGRGAGHASSETRVAREAVLTFARDRQSCRYTTVDIMPVVQRKAAQETRELTEQEAWEALNETWAVFVGWAVWTKLEAGLAGPPSGKAPNGSVDGWLSRLAKANERGELRGYYEPEEASERALTKKRYLALTHRIAPDEARALMKVVMEVPDKAAGRLQQLLQRHAEPLTAGTGCHPASF
ncbi:MAG: hypothetical protein U0172_05760 [Nitrospiraceae bacterium]